MARLNELEGLEVGSDFVVISADPAKTPSPRTITVGDTQAELQATLYKFEGVTETGDVHASIISSTRDVLPGKVIFDATNDGVVSGHPTDPVDSDLKKLGLRVDIRYDRKSPPQVRLLRASIVSQGSLPLHREMKERIVKPRASGPKHRLGRTA